MGVAHAILFCVEKGLLENQSRLLVDSFNEFAKDEGVRFFAFSPRKSNQPHKSTIDYLVSQGVTHIDKNLNTEFLHYPIANKILCCEYFEKSFDHFDSIIFVDTDTVFLNPMIPEQYNNRQGLFLKPVGHKGPGSIGKEDVNDVFWSQVCELCGVELPPVDCSTSIKSIRIRGYYNAGLVWASQLPGFYAQWKKDFLTILNSTLRPFKFVSKDGDNFRCIDQVALAITAQRFRKQLQILPPTYNYHIPFRPIINSEINPEINQLIHVHYHKWFQHRDFISHVTTQGEQNIKQVQWLRKRLPLEPFIFDEFKC